MLSNRISNIKNDIKLKNDIKYHITFLVVLADVNAAYSADNNNQKLISQ